MTAKVESLVKFLEISGFLETFLGKNWRKNCERLSWVEVIFRKLQKYKKIRGWQDGLISKSPSRILSKIQKNSKFQKSIETSKCAHEVKTISNKKNYSKIIQPQNLRLKIKYFQQIIWVPKQGWYFLTFDKYEIEFQNMKE